MVEKNKGLFRDSLMDSNFRKGLLDGEPQTASETNGRWLDGGLGYGQWNRWRNVVRKNGFSEHEW